MIVELPLIRNEKNTKELSDLHLILLPSIMIVLIIAILGILNIHYSIILIVTTIMLYLVIRHGRSFFPDWIRKSDIEGSLILTSDKVAIRKNEQSVEIKTSDINRIKLNFNYVKGLKYGSRDIIHNGLAQLNISIRNGQGIKIKTIIENLNQLNALKEILNYWYKSGIVIREFMGRNELKTILFKDNWTYEEIQELKEQLNVKSFY